MRHNLGDSLWKVTSRRIVRSLKHMGSVAFTLIPGALGYVSNGLFPHPLQSTLPAFICIVECPSEWDFFWNELIWKLLPCKQFSSAAKNTIVSSSEIRGLDFPFACFYIGLCGPKVFFPTTSPMAHLIEPEGTWVLPSQSLLGKFSPIWSSSSSSLRAYVFSASLTDGDLSSSSLLCYCCWQSSTCSLIVYHK